MEKEIQQLQNKAEQEVFAAATAEQLEAVKVSYLGRKSALNSFFSRMKDLSPDRKGELGKKLNEVKAKISRLIEDKQAGFRASEEKIDLTFPAYKPVKGSKHILSYVNETICGIFEKLGFEVAEGTEIDDEWHNFTALNIPLDHPSRDAFDTFYLDLPQGEKGRYLLRSHTSPTQIHVMDKRQPPLAVVSPGRVYRPDKVDASHSFMFHQIEGFCVAPDITFSHLKGVLLHFARSFYSPDIQLRFRPHFFPFTEPSAEVDVGCVICKQKGCSVCKGSGWLEILGCGMIHPAVLEHCSIDSRKYQGFAFGMGVERIAMLKYGIHDIRLFYENDERFLRQFNQV